MLIGVQGNPNQLANTHYNKNIRQVLKFFQTKSTLETAHSGFLAPVCSVSTGSYPKRSTPSPHGPGQLSTRELLVATQISHSVPHVLLGGDPPSCHCTLSKSAHNLWLLHLLLRLGSCSLLTPVVFSCVRI